MNENTSDVNILNKGSPRSFVQLIKSMSYRILKKRDVIFF